MQKHINMLRSFSLANKGIAYYFKIIFIIDNARIMLVSYGSEKNSSPFV